MNAVVTKNPTTSIVVSGITFGVIFGIIGAALDAAYVFTSSPLAIALIALAIVLGGILFYGWAGMRVARQTGKALYGTTAAALAGIISFLLGYATNLVLAYNATDIMRQNTQNAANLFTGPFRSLVAQNIHIQFTNQYVIDNAINSIGAIWIIAILAAVVGLVAALIGKQRVVRGA